MADRAGDGAAHGATGVRPSPRVAYAQWLDACTGAGWTGRPAPEQVPVAAGLDRVAASPVHARWPSPRFACAAMDGIAIRAVQASGSADASGTSSWQLAASSFSWVDTGNPMPGGTDTVVRRERVRVGADGSAAITGPIVRGQHVRAVGEDFQAGQELIAAGRRLRPADLAIAAAAGHATLAVARQPVVAIIPTGNEIQPVGSVLPPGGVIDSNSIMLAARARQLGSRPVVSDVRRDDEAAIAAEVRRAAVTADLVLIIAGSSAGRSDHTATVIARAGGLAVSGAAVRPGHPVLLGHIRAAAARPDGAPASPPFRAVPVIGVPGYPIAAAVIFELFAVPLLTMLQGAPPEDHRVRQVQLACDWVSSPEAEDWVPVSLASVPAHPDAAGPVVATPGRRGAGAISQLAGADAWWPIPVGQGEFARGDLIEVQRIPSLRRPEI